MKKTFLTIILGIVLSSAANAQLKEAAQLATLSPTILVIQSDMENYKKSHYMLSTITYMGSYMILDSKWKAALLTILVGATKELVYDSMLGKGEPLWVDMKWNTLGTAQGLTFTFSLSF
ncbi:hypothetical protein [Rhodohalobacter barkolensis]|uniref:DUF5683 domain-containing protein n=1 Tax=Rhodohalobacter barkolensis TaxID=2053187 RepID=A0A2N0VGF9_9BACT|nr:hypothetical protein [Rhodohalobacter barkolensis]PKD43282.1 hypothetical protein CWD77_11750 [Rhodohalobacter barkolensis]